MWTQYILKLFIKMNLNLKVTYAIDSPEVVFLLAWIHHINP